MKISVTVDMVEQKKKNKQEARRELDRVRDENRNEKEDIASQDLDQRKEMERQEELMQEMLHKENDPEILSEKVLSVSDHLAVRNMMDVIGLASTAVR